MNKSFKLLSGVTVIICILAIASCTKVCDLGYEGDHCTTPVRDKYIGTFSGHETCGSVTDTFSVAFTEVTGDVTKVRVTNIYNSGINAIGTVLENGSLTIAPQAFGTGNISGSITSVSGKINISYLVTISGLPDANCTWVQN